MPERRRRRRSMSVLPPLIVLVLLLIAWNYRAPPTSSLFAVVVVHAQQSAAGQDTLIGLVGRDYVMMGADVSTSGGGGIALTSVDVDKMSVIHDGYRVRRRRRRRHHRRVVEDVALESTEQHAIVVGYAGDAADADRLVGMLRTHVQVREYEAGIGNDVTCVFDGRRSGSGRGGTTSSYMASGIDSSTTSSDILPDEEDVRVLSSAGMDAESIAYMSRSEISSRMRSRRPLQLCLLIGGMVRCSGFADLCTATASSDMATNADNAVAGGSRVRKQISIGSASYNVPRAWDNDATTDEDAHSSNESASRSSRIPDDDGDDHRSTTSNPYLAPKLFWLDQYGSLQNMKYAAHGYGSNFAYSILDRGYNDSMSRREAAALIRECFEQLRLRYVINSPRPPRIKCIDRYGVMEVIDMPTSSNDD